MREYTLPTFGGADLRSDPEEAAGALDMLNVDLGLPGRVHTRDGYAGFFTALDATIPLISFYRTGLATQLIVQGNTAARAYNTSGTVVASSAAATGATPLSCARIGTSTAEYVYVGFGASGGNTQRWDGTSWTTPGGTLPIATCLAVTPWDNRLAAARGNQITNGSRVQFSDPGAPETFGANNYIDLIPGDGETITAMVPWRDKLFVFKQTKFFVFYGTSEDSAGNPIFNYRTVHAGVGAPNHGTYINRPAIATTNGVVFHDPSGIFVTTGGTPVRISTAIDPALNGDTLPHFQGQTGTNYAQNTSLAYLPTGGAGGDGRLFASVTNSSKQAALWVRDDATGAWSFWAFSGTLQPELVTYRTSTATVPENLYFSFSDTTVYKLTSGLATDAGASMASRYRTGFLDLGTPDAEKLVREVILDGTGSVTVKMAVNDASTLGTGATVTLGTSPAVAQGRDGRANWGRNLSVELSATSGAWSVSRFTANILGERESGAKSP